MSELTLLGNQATKYPDDYAPEILETFDNKHPENDYFVKFNCPEFTSLCPIKFLLKTFIDYLLSIFSGYISCSAKRLNATSSHLVPGFP